MAGESLSGQSGWLLTGLAPGALIAGYRVESQIGAGGMAMVLRARDDALGRTIALKILAPARASDAEFRQRFVRESRAVAAVDHPHIIPVYAAGEAGGVLYLAMRFVVGGDLRSVVEREGPLSGDRAVTLLSPIASALDAAHAAGLVHRDVKPANILVDSAPGRPEHPYLSDFGLAKGSASSTGLTGTGAFLGTPDYAAPEQISGKPARSQTDQYALACVVYTVLTGSLPFAREESMAVLWAHMYDQPPSLSTMRPDLPAALDTVLARALAKTPEERYAACGEFIDALRAALSDSARAGSGVALASAGSPSADAAVWRRRQERSAQAQSSHTQTAPQSSTLDSPVLTDRPGDLSFDSPSGSPENADPPATLVTLTAPFRRLRRRRAERGRGKWPIAAAAIVLLVLLIVGSGIGFWQYNQSKYYVGVQNGYVAIFRGTNQSLAGIRLSSAAERSTLKISELRSSDQAALSRTITEGNMNDARQLIDQLQAQANQCHSAWSALVSWQAEASSDEIAGDSPGPMPVAPNPAKCASSSAFGIRASELPSS